ncbi:MAG: FecR domain-containing protein [Verrucomicrobia bacterium]|nr:FecR domain-containing protein [Verrucomicrobiota bacterium]MDE3098898.1 FecR domain-containing protein [Verrucomicrobiota bacterium]
MKSIFLVFGLALLVRFSAGAAPLAESTFTEIINDVATVAATGAASPAKVKEVLKAPQRVRTGPDSRAELVAPDQTITRVGANTIFSFADSGRTLNLEQGNLLFHAPKGIGGGTIKTAGAAAAVLGTTLIVSATADGGFKVILLEGSGAVTLPNGTSATLHAGQLVFVLPGGTLSPVLNINLGRLVAGSALVNGFPDQLTSLSLINIAILQQNKLFKSGEATDTGLPPDVFIIPPFPGNGWNAIDHGAYQTRVPPPTPPLPPTQFPPNSFKGPP